MSGETEHHSGKKKAIRNKIMVSLSSTFGKGDFLMLPLKENCLSELNAKLHVFFFIYTKIKAKNTN